MVISRSSSNICEIFVKQEFTFDFSLFYQISKWICWNPNTGLFEHKRFCSKIKMTVIQNSQFSFSPGSWTYVSILFLRGLPGGSEGCVCLRYWRPRFDLGFRKVPWRRKWQPTPVLLPGESHVNPSIAWWTILPMGLQRVGHDWVTSLYFFYFISKRHMYISVVLRNIY